MNTKELIDEAVALPVEDRILVADSLLRSLNAPETEIDEQWIVTAQRRLTELRTGAVKPVPAQMVFANIQNRKVEQFISSR